METSIVRPEADFADSVALPSKTPLMSCEPNEWTNETEWNGFTISFKKFLTAMLWRFQFIPDVQSGEFHIHHNMAGFLKALTTRIELYLTRSECTFIWLRFYLMPSRCTRTTLSWWRKLERKVDDDVRTVLDHRFLLNLLRKYESFVMRFAYRNS